MPGDATAPVVIIGAGQAGLSVAYSLRSGGLVAGRNLLVFDPGTHTVQSARTSR